MLSNKLKDYFKNNVKLSLKSSDKLFIVTKSDLFYEINIYDEKIQTFISNSDDSILEEMIVKELCFQQIVDLSYGDSDYIAKTIDNKIFCWGNNYFGQLADLKIDSDLKNFNKPKLNELLSDLKIDVIKCGAFHSLALTQNREVYAWGTNEAKQIGKGFKSRFQSTPIKLDIFNDEKIAMISCGLLHSMALTESGRVFSWGMYGFEQLSYSNKEIEPKHIELNGVLISKISCGESHSLLLSRDGVLYSIGYKVFWRIESGENLIKPFVLYHEKKFVDISSHWCENISIALSFDNIYYVWGDFREGDILKSIETNFKSFNETFIHFIGYNLEVSKELIEFNDLFFRNGHFKEYFNLSEVLGHGSYGTVSKVRFKGDTKEFAIKKIKFNNQFKNEISREFHNFCVVRRLLNRCIAIHHRAWFEYSMNDNKIILYILMDLCNNTLEDAIDELENNSLMKKDGILTLIGYYIASQLFIKILESVQYLHQHNIIHRDLKPDNIMLKRRESVYFIKICDFGLIALHEYEEQLHSADKGQVKFAAPEVLAGNKYDTKADIYSLGIIFQRLFDIDFDGY
jgi:alpha-tubulin suppressor-like RCC1 family protein